MHENEITQAIIGLSIEVHRRLGPGLLESAYAHCLYYELVKHGLNAEKEKPLPLIYDEIKLECGYRADLIVENRVIIEVKSVEALNEVHIAQMLTYLRFSNCKLGLLINFNVLRLKEGLKRVVLNF